MAVTVSSPKNSLNGKSFIELLGFAAEAKALADKGWQFKLTAKNLVMEKGPYKFEKGLTVEFLQACGAGVASTSEFDAFTKSLQIQLAQALAIEQDEAAGSASGSMKSDAPSLHDFVLLTEASKKAFFSVHDGMVDKIAMIKKFREVFGVGLKEAKDAVEAYLAQKSPVKMNVTPEQIATVKAIGASKWPVTDLSKLSTAPVVKLRDAKSMYQPVKGSSSGSRYFMVAAADDVRVAARYHGQTLSIRIEGPAWKKHKATIAKSGFSTVDESKDYASVHLAVADDMLANKTLGAVLLGLGVQFETPLPLLKVIKGKGG